MVARFPPEYSGDIESWIAQTRDYLLYLSDIRLPTEPQAVLLAHQVDSLRKKTSVDGLMMYEPVPTNPVFSRSGEWVAIGSRWLGEWVNGNTYYSGDIVLDFPYLMVANKTTTDRPAPQPTGAPFFVYNGASPVGNIAAKTLVVGTEYTFTSAFFMKQYRVYTKVDSGYVVYYQIAGGQVVQLFAFTASITGWQTFDVGDVLIPPGAVLTVAVRITEPDPTPTTFNGNWDYQTPNNEAIPLDGEIIQATREIESLRVSTTDDDAGDRRTELLNLTIGDIIDGAGRRWTIIGITDNTTWFDFTVAPGSQGVAGLQDFIFETVVSTPIDTVVDVGFWSGDGQIRGLNAVDGGALNFTQDAYGIDIELQTVTISPDWDFMSTAGGNASSSETGVTAKFDSEDVLIATPSSTDTIEHGLGETPKLVSAMIRCEAPEGGYSVDDEVIIDSNAATISMDSINIYVSIPNGPKRIGRKDTGALFNITPGDWKLIVRAWV